MRPLRFALFVYMAMLACATRATATDSSIMSLLSKIDSIIPVRDGYSVARRENIAQLSDELRNADNDVDKYNIYRSLYGAYRSYRNDSALQIAEQRLATARRIGDPDKIISASINLADSYSLCGDYHQSIEILDTLDRSRMEPYHLRYMYSVYGQTYSRLGTDDLLQSHKIGYNRQVKSYRDSSLAMYDPSEPDYSYIKVLQLMDNAYWNDALALFNKIESKSGGIESNATLLAQKAHIYHNLGDVDNEKMCLAKAAVLDLQNGIKSYSSLLRLAELLNNENDIDRAYNYIRCALDDSYFSGAKSRTAEILQAIPLIDNAYSHKMAQRRKTLWLLIGIITLLSIILCIALWFNRSKLISHRRMRKTIDENTVRLNQAIRLLDGANRQKQKYILDLFDAYSEYISNFTKFRINLLRLLKVGKYSEALELSKSDRVENDELRSLYARFDTMFITMYPEFINEYNSMVRPDEQIDPDSTSLPSAVRIVALMRVGITSTAQIASMLHYTQQTVYNYRNRIRAALVVPKEQFDKWIDCDIT